MKDEDGQRVQIEFRVVVVVAAALVWEGPTVDSTCPNRKWRWT
jgi:hypothetical protein